MTIMYEPTGSRVLRSSSSRSDRLGLHPVHAEDTYWSSTFMAMSSSSGLRNVAAHFSSALDTSRREQVHVAVIKYVDGKTDLPGSALWMTTPYTFIDTVRAETRKVTETADVVDAFEQLRTDLGLTQKEMFKATGIRKRTFHSWADKPAGSRPRVASLGRLWELADAVDDLHNTVDQPLARWLRGDPQRIDALLDARFDDLVDMAVDRTPLPQREIGTSVAEGIAEEIDTPIIRSGGPLVTEDVEDGFAR
ncbi:hypothetical protein HCA61_15730 [Rhodococcus sp. HNM0563]|uniref:hypothetical protein n=1 Tax=Rhodococcus sp. HNM0563 TaxID=2716339 RepID=UPI00146A6B76|nr:hypothetical protein [Rhodococcus sp. HNM0563]NLU63705.1 hypothetical protein [Rhodococcus sp. HNM0563]